MDFQLNDGQRAIRRLARDFADGEVKPAVAEVAVLTIGEGTDEVRQMVIARHLGC